MDIGEAEMNTSTTLSSIYVKFQVTDDRAVAGISDIEALFRYLDNNRMVIAWKPAIALNPSEEYALARIPSGETFIMARPDR